MSPGLLLRGDCYGDHHVTKVESDSSYLDLSLYTPFPFLSTVPHHHSPIFTSSFTLDETSRNQKRLKRAPPSPDQSSFTSNSTFYCGTTCDSASPRLQFRDHIRLYAQRYLAIEFEESSTSTDDDDVNEEGFGSVDAMKLVQQLICCAEAVACRDKAHASALLSELGSNALALGTSFQRVASCFVQGLADRLALIHPPLGTVGIVGLQHRTTSSMRSFENDESLSLAYELCPQIKFGHFVANTSILAAFEGESYLHVIDLGMSLGLPLGHQWRGLISSLANRVGKPIRGVRITGVGKDGRRIQSIGDDLIHYAKSLGIKLQFQCIESNLEDLQVKDFNILENEVIVINSILQLHCAVKESRGALNSVLQVLHELSPKLLVVVEQDSNHNGPFFLGRFMEALHYYSAIFDSLDAMLPKYDTKRAKMEQFFYGEEIKNIVSCEGPARVERHERVDQWRRRMSRAGFQAMPLKMINEAKQWVRKHMVIEGYTVVEEKGCLVLGWKSKPIIATSCWKC